MYPATPIPSTFTYTSSLRGNQFRVLQVHLGKALERLAKGIINYTIPKLIIVCETKEAQAWRYSPLPSTSHLRILHLQPSKDSNIQLECRLTEYSLSTNPDYQAVSYVWGKDDSSSSIICNGAILAIGRNISDALRRFRKCSEEISLWANSICINQGDINERNNQVRIMDQIYRKASHVLIWLGREDEYENTELAMRYMQDLLGCSEEIMESVVGDNRDDGAAYSADLYQKLETKEVSQCNLPKFDAFISFFIERPWFQRAWTFQESWLAQNRTYHCGKFEFPDESLLVTASCLMALSTNMNNIRYSLPWDGKLASMLLRERSFQGSSPYQDLHYLLESRRRAGCKYPSDLIYSLYGVVSDRWK